jgi:hypothetical protein
MKVVEFDSGVVFSMQRKIKKTGKNSIWRRWVKEHEK